MWLATDLGAVVAAGLAKFLDQKLAQVKMLGGDARRNCFHLLLFPCHRGGGAGVNRRRGSCHAGKRAFREEPILAHRLYTWYPLCLPHPTRSRHQES